MKRWIIGISLAGVTATGGLIVGDIATADLVATLDDPITLNEAMKFRAPSHTVEVSDNGLIELVVGGDKRYGLIPAQAHGKGKPLFLDIESEQNKAVIKEAFGPGSEIIVKNTPRSFSKVVSFTQDFLKTIPEGAKYVEVSFDLSGWDVPDGTYTERIQLQQDVWLEKALAWDSSEGDPDNDIANGNYTDVEFVISGDTLTKRIPVAWLKTAVFPIYTDAVFTFGTKELADVGPSGTVDVVPIGIDKAAICWQGNGDASAEGQCVIADISGTDLAFGAVSDFSADAGPGANNGALGACSAGNDRWVVLFQDDADADDGTARVASSTSTTINGYGTAFDFSDGVVTEWPVCTYVATDTVVIGYVDNTNDDFEVIACTISETYTLTCGTPQILRDETAVTPADISCVTLSSNKFVCNYHLNAANRYLRAGTVSGTTITLGTELQTNNSAGGADEDIGHNIISPQSDKFVLHWSRTTGSPISQNLALGTVSGTTITLGATTTPIIATTTSFTSLLSIDSDSAALYYQQGATDAGTTFLAAIPITLNFNTLTFSTSTAETVDATTDPGSLHAAKISECKFLFAWEDDNDTNDLFAIIGDVIVCPPFDDTYFDLLDN